MEIGPEVSGSLHEAHQRIKAQQAQALAPHLKLRSQYVLGIGIAPEQPLPRLPRTYRQFGLFVINAQHHLILADLHGLQTIALVEQGGRGQSVI